MKTQSVEEFMRQYFDELIVEEKREQANRAPFYHKFHTSDCRWNSRAGTLEMIQSEKVLTVSNSDTTAEVVTTRETSHPESVHQLRYHLMRNLDSWLIRSVDIWCAMCRGVRGTESCMLCHGTGWLDGKFAKTRLSAKGPPRQARG
jgi:hypothetical protein